MLIEIITFMKNIIIIAFSVIPNLLFGQTIADKFVGDWELVSNSGNKIRNICIKKVHDNYYLSYNTLQAAKEDKLTAESIEFGTQTFNLKDGYLWDKENKEKVVLNNESGHIKWRHNEWQKTAR